MKKLKCSSCGAELEVEENKEYAECKYCGTKYKLNEDHNINIKLDDNMKEVLNNGMGTVKHLSKFMIIPIIIFVIIFIMIIVFSFMTTSRFISSSNDSYNEIEEKMKQQEDEEKKREEESKKYHFNFQFNNGNGTKNALFLSSILDDIIESNKTNDRLVALVFDGKETTDEKEIIDIKHSLDGDYEVSLNYGDDGYINKIIVEKINN